MSIFSTQNWTLKKKINNVDLEAVLSSNYNGNPLLIKATAKANTFISNRAGYIYQFAEVPGLGRIQLTDKAAIALDNLSLFFWSKLPNYQLIFERSAWAKDLSLQIYESNMPIYSDSSVSVVVPSQSAATPTTSSVPASATSVVLLSNNTNRKQGIITNTSNQDLFIQFGATASVASYVVKLAKVPATNIPSSYEFNGYTGAIAGIWAAAGSGAANIVELV
jgi:hypothetical protein